MLTAQELKGVVAVMATPAKPGAESVLATDTVDLDETARIADQMVKDGVGAMMALGTTGECATLSDEDYRAFVECFLSAVGDRVPTFVGTTALGTHKIAERIKFVKSVGATGTLLGIPMWQPATLDMAVRHYADISDAFPDFPVMIYANARAFRFNFGVDFWRGIGQKAPTVMSSKFNNASIYKECLEVTNGQVNFVPNEGVALRFAEASPETCTAFWAHAMGMSAPVALMDAINARDWERAKQISADMHWAGEPVRPWVEDQEMFASFNIQVNKLRENVAGYTHPGPIRPPYHVLPEGFAEACDAAGKRHAEIEQKYVAMRAPAIGGGES